MEEPFLAFSDEKGHGGERYWGIGLVTGPPDVLEKLQKDCTNICKSCSLESLEWKDINGDSKRQKAASQYIKNAINVACEKSLRIDVLVWDMHDSRHSVIGRRDTRNLERMYYKIITHAWRQWGKLSWELFPDTSSQIDWESIHQCISRSRVKPLKKPYLMELFKQEHARFTINKLEQLDSKQSPLIQLADIFVGMGCFSVEEKDSLQRYVEKQNYEEQLTLLPKDSENDSANVSDTKKARFELINYLDKLCKGVSLGVSLRTKGYLRTPDPKNPINFWLYEPQHDLDKAPVS